MGQQSNEPELVKEGFAESWRASVVELAISYAVNHPIRLACLAILIVRVASASEIARELSISVSTASRHISGLYKDGGVEYVKTEVGGGRRGAPEHYYKAASPPTPEITDEDWQAMPEDDRRQMVGPVLQAIVAQSLAALACRTMERDDQLHLSWQAIPVDQEGEDELAELLADTSKRLEAIKTRSETRLEEAEKDGTVRIVAALGFRRADPGEWPGRLDPARAS